MTLKNSLLEIAAAPYDPYSILGQRQPIFPMLERFGAKLEQLVPRGHSVRVSKGVGRLPFGLWVAVLDDNVTNTPTDGLYVVWLFDESRRTVSLSLMQGVTAASKRAKDLEIPRLQLLRDEAEQLRHLIPDDISMVLSRKINLQSTSARTRAYEAGNVVAYTWQLDNHLVETDLVSTFDQFVELYEYMVEAKEAALTVTPGLFMTPARSISTSTSNRPPIFLPKSDSDYIVNSRNYVEPQQRRRSHEKLVRNFGEFAMSRSFVAATNQHPIDLVLNRGNLEMIVEAKMLDRKHPAAGIRESIGQLFEYRKFLRPEKPETPLVAVYNSYPGVAYLQLLEDLHIVICWREGEGFEGTDRAKRFELV